MAKAATAKTAPTTKTITLPRVDDTKNYAKFGVEKNGSGGFGTYYLPLDEAEGVTAMTLTYTRVK